MSITFDHAEGAYKRTERNSDTPPEIDVHELIFGQPTEADIAELAARPRPINWAELGSSAKDLWEERQMKSIRRARLTAQS